MTNAMPNPTSNTQFKDATFDNNSTSYHPIILLSSNITKRNKRKQLLRVYMKANSGESRVQLGSEVRARRHSDVDNIPVPSKAETALRPSSK